MKNKCAHISSVSVSGEELVPELQCVLHPYIAPLPASGLRSSPHRLQ
jgi:hypothetical protein